MKIVKTTIAAALFGMSISAFAAVSDISNVTHGSKVGQQMKVGQINEPRFSDLSNVTEAGANEQVKPFAKTAGNYSFGDISSVTHN
jgi:hypothetical protein